MSENTAIHIVAIMNAFEERYLRKRGGGVAGETLFCETKALIPVSHAILSYGGYILGYQNNSIREEAFVLVM